LLCWFLKDLSRYSVPDTRCWPQIRSPHRTLGPWRQATLGG